MKNKKQKLDIQNYSIFDFFHKIELIFYYFLSLIVVIEKEARSIGFLSTLQKNNNNLKKFKFQFQFLKFNKLDEKFRGIHWLIFLYIVNNLL